MKKLSNLRKKHAEAVAKLTEARLLAQSRIGSNASVTKKLNAAILEVQIRDASLFSRTRSVN
ncbi:MAG: hypothetical protein VYA34_13715 [Myxococcota bacterium]|nr:hypothetical protein [Myxococcota bacterium]